MAEAVVSIAVGGILNKASSLAVSEVILAWGYENKLDGLKRDLELISAVLEDAEKKISNKAVTVWLKQLKQVIDEADDVLDEIDYEKLRREVKNRNWMVRKVSSLPSLKKLSFRIEMGHKIENVSKKLSEINKRANELKLESVQSVGPVSNSLFRETDPNLDGFEVVGRESDEQHIIQILTQSRTQEKLTIVPIVGMGGMGKTTLAKSIYNKPTIEQHFDVKAWLCVSVEVDVTTLLAKIYESFAREECKSRMRPNIIADLQNKLGSKRYFLVLDDVWDEKRAHWDDFKSCMVKVNSQSGSCILVTTRSSGIGTNAMSEDVDFYVLQSLPDDTCWSIFTERAFVAGRSTLLELEEIGRCIVKKCRGLPLLVSVIGSMLRNCDDKEKWLSIAHRKVWDLEEEVERVQNILKLSFDYLPNSVVKQCFLYCSIFKKDTILEREELVRFWISLGLVQEDEMRNKEAKDVGNDIFQILVRSSLFQDVKTDEYGYVTCSMHDLVHDLSSSLSKDEISCWVYPTNDDIANIPQVKHFSIFPHDERFGPMIRLESIISVLFKNNITAGTLHTLILEGVVLKNISFHNLKNLRILKLKTCGLEKIDDSVGKLVHLRYLDLSNNSKMKTLPNSIGKLYHLLTLNLYGCERLENLPQDMSNLTSLLHLMYGKYAKGFEAVSRYELFNNFDQDLPIHNVGRLTSLITLPFFRVGQEKICQISELSRLKYLTGELCITNLEKINNKEDAVKAELSRKRNLYGIYFCWSDYRGERDVNQNDKDVLEGLQPHGNVESLEIKNFSGDKFPSWVEKMAIDIKGKCTPFNKLVKFKLSRCNKCDYLPMLEDLPFLEELVLMGMEKLTCLSTSSGVNTGSIKPLSPSLRSLQLRNMKKLVKWNVDPTTSNSSIMLSPVLEELTIYECPSIVHLDECHPHPLVSLSISRCKNLESFTSIQGLTSLETLRIESCPSLSEIPYLHNFERHPLKTLWITDCTKLSSVPCRLFNCFSLLNRLALARFSKELHSFPSLQGIENLRNLYSLYLYGWHHWESIPEEVQHLPSLRFLYISKFGMSELPEWLAIMSFTIHVRFFNCLKLNEETIQQAKARARAGIPTGGSSSGRGGLIFTKIRTTNHK